MASKDAARNRSQSQLDWPALGAPQPDFLANGEVVYLWGQAAAAERDEIGESVPRSDYLMALVGLVDELTQRLVASERARAVADAERDAALALAQRSRSEAAESGRQLLAYCRTLVDANDALDEASAENRALAIRAAETRAALEQLAQSPLALPVRARVQALAEALGTLPR